MRVLYIGSSSGTSLHRSHAMMRLGHTVVHIDPYKAFHQSFTRWGSKIGYLGFNSVVRRYVLEEARPHRYDLVWVDQGELCDRTLIRILRGGGMPVVNYCPDNPYVHRDGQRWRLFLQALPEYDLIVTPRTSSANAAYAAGAQSVFRVMFAADEVAHRPNEISVEEKATFASRVSFVGTWMPERGPFLERLIQRKVPLTIFGPRWNKAPEFSALKPHVRLGALSAGDYVKAVQCSSIAIGLLSKGNEDLHTTRSIEIPSIGTLLCAERTSEHLEMYAESEEAVFWDSADECADKCLTLLNNPAQLVNIAKAGNVRARRNGYFNERLILSILERLRS